MFLRSHPISVALFMAATLAIPMSAETKMKIASVGPQYTPKAGSQLPEPVSMRGYFFEVEKETGRARVVIDYTYPNQAAYGFDGGAGPQPTMAQIPGLRYDPASKAVLYDAAGRSVVCATVRDQKVLFWSRSSIVPTGACKINSQPMDQVADTGWNIRRFRTIDTFFEVD